MAKSEDEIGCTLAAGENKICPAKNWDTAVEGPSPLFVDPETGSTWISSGDLAAENNPFPIRAEALSTCSSGAQSNNRNCCQFLFQVVLENPINQPLYSR